MQDNPAFSILIFLAGAWLFKMWLGDARAGRSDSRAMPGASFSGKFSVFLAVAGAVLILAAETVLEKIFGFDASQSSVKFWALLVWISAAATEEIIFRGYIAIKNRGKVLLWAGAFAASVLFAAMHPFLWDYSAESGFVLNLSPKAFFSTGFIFLNSMWLYFARFNPSNKTASLMPCFAAHAAYNIGVFAVKAAQGFVLWEF